MCWMSLVTLQTLNIEGYIKKKNLIVLIDSGSTHNFINYKLATLLNCFICLAPKFQEMIANGGIRNCSRKYYNININMEKYLLNNPMIGAYVVLGVQWFQWLLIFKNFSRYFPQKERN